MHLRPEVRDAFVHLARHSDVAGAVCACVAAGQFAEATDVRRVCTVSGIAMARAGEVEAFLAAAATAGLFQRASQLTWRPVSRPLHAELAPLFVGAALYRAEVHSDHDKVQVVVTKPPSPSRFTKELQAATGDWGLVDTREALPGIAESARTRFCVMTPYVDEIGAPILLNLFARVPKGVRRVLISRADSGDLLPPGLRGVAGDLAALAVSVLSFRVEREGTGGNETSHAKVVLADDHTAYVGSLNMNRWSLEYSLEVGVCVAGRSAALIANVIDAAERVSVPMRSPSS
jgi:phosphatidylserine/phosphatidylglycerophosphate/cardiolipin synthase-like enzyme